jgi:predicted dienelactone hydrolase
MRVRYPSDAPEQGTQLGNPCGDNDLAATHLKPDAVAVVGHSPGGYTAPAVAGGDDRLNALVLLAPATAWFQAEDSLHTVRIPILMLTAEHDAHTPQFHLPTVARSRRLRPGALPRGDERANSGLSASSAAACG